MPRYTLPAPPAPSGRSPLGTPAPARGAAAARNNVVPIGGRHGASAAPSYEPDDDGDEPENNEATTVASAADLGLLDFGRPARDDGAVPAAKPAAKKDDKPAPKGPTGGFKAIPPPGARPLASPPRAAAPIAPVAARKSTPAPAAFDEPEPEPKRASFAPPPPAVEPIAAPIAVAPIAPVATPAPRDDRRGGLGVFALMGIAGAMAAGAVLMYALVQRFVLAPAPPPTTAIVATIATLAPASGVEPQHVASIDIAPPPSSGVATIATPPPTAAPPPTGTVTGPHHGATPPPTSGARASTKAAAAEDSRFSQFADDGAGPAPIATGPSHSADDPTAGRHSSAELTADQIREVVHTGQRALTTCWETALRQAGHVEGDVRYDVDVTIGMTGRVTSARARGPAMGALQECLERGVRRWGFPPSATETSTSFPLLFSAQQ